MIAGRLEGAIRSTAFVAMARLVNGLFFLTASAFSLLSYSPFGYGHFIKPSVFPPLNEFVALSPWLFGLALLLTTQTLLSRLESKHVRAYLSVMTLLGVAVAVRRPLAAIGNSWWGLPLGLFSLALPIWLTVIDYSLYRAPAVVRVDRRRALAACTMAAVVAWLTYAAASPLRLRDTVGLELAAGDLAIAAGWSLVLEFLVFMSLFVTLCAVIAVVRAATSRAWIEYWAFVALLAGLTAVVVYMLICKSIAFTGWEPALGSAALGVAVALIWADVALLRGQRATGADRRAIDALELFAAPVGGVDSRTAAMRALVMLPIAAYLAAGGVSRFDWNFLFQKLSVLATWLAVFSACYALVAASGYTGRSRWPLVAAPLCALVASAGLSIVHPRAAVALDRYAAIDPSYRLVRDVQTIRPASTAEYYAFLQSHTLLMPSQVPHVDVDFVTPLGVSSGRKPYVFVFILDSLRRDYVSSYNPAVTFTPEIAKLAADSDVFTRAFTRYAGTGLAIPSIWTGGLVVHRLEQHDFPARNTLAKLLDANHYLRLMKRDTIADELLPPGDPNVVQLDREKTTMQVNVCGTRNELEQRIEEVGTSRPIFFYSMPQDIHIAVASKRPVPDGETYPGFFAPLASSVRRVDGCIGQFVDFLKRTNRYDDSVIILTSDHGDSLGEEGRWGHAYLMFPEVMRVPLIVHVPAWLKAGVAADHDALTFTTDLAPSLYALFGYEPADLGPLFGRPLFVPANVDTSWRRRDAFLLASSYGAVYGMLDDNGRRLYVVDSVDGTDAAFDMSGMVGQRVAITPSMTETNRRLIREHLNLLAATYRYHPSP